MTVQWACRWSVIKVACGWAHCLRPILPVPPGAVLLSHLPRTRILVPILVSFLLSRLLLACHGPLLKQPIWTPLQLCLHSPSFLQLDFPYQRSCRPFLQPPSTAKDDTTPIPHYRLVVDEHRVSFRLQSLLNRESRTASLLISVIQDSTLASHTIYSDLYNFNRPEPT